MLQTNPIVPHIVRTDVTQKGICKVRRQTGDPVAALKQMTRFTPVPQPAPNNLVVPLNVLDSAASQAAVQAGTLVFHCVGDTGGIHGTATQEAVAVAMENQINAAADGLKPAFFFHLGDVICFNGQSTLYKSSSTSPTSIMPRPFSPYPAIIRRHPCRKRRRARQ